MKWLDLVSQGRYFLVPEPFGARFQTRQSCLLSTHKSRAMIRLISHVNGLGSGSAMESTVRCMESLEKVWIAKVKARNEGRDTSCANQSDGRP